MFALRFFVPVPECLAKLAGNQQILPYGCRYMIAVACSDSSLTQRMPFLLIVRKGKACLVLARLAV